MVVQLNAVRIFVGEGLGIVRQELLCRERMDDEAKSIEIGAMILDVYGNDAEEGFEVRRVLRRSDVDLGYERGDKGLQILRSISHGKDWQLV